MLHILMIKSTLLESLTVNLSVHLSVAQCMRARVSMWVSLSVFFMRNKVRKGLILLSLFCFVRGNCPDDIISSSTLEWSPSPTLSPSPSPPPPHQQFRYVSSLSNLIDTSVNSIPGTVPYCT